MESFNRFGTSTGSVTDRFSAPSPPSDASLPSCRKISGSAVILANKIAGQPVPTCTNH